MLKKRDDYLQNSVRRNHRRIEIVTTITNPVELEFWHSMNGDLEKALNDYMDHRELIIPVSGHEDALFLSMQNRRITVRSVENLVKKYSSLVTSLKKITPHNLRSTYGTNLYQETGDIYLVADVLGHSSVDTTRKHYADMTDARRRMAAEQVELPTFDQASEDKK